MRKVLKAAAWVAGVLLAVSLMLRVSSHYFGHRPHLVDACSPPSAVRPDLAGLFDKIRARVQLELDSHHAANISLYVRDLKTGAWFAINQDDKFTAASLLKVPLMMECLEQVQARPNLLEKRLLFSGEADWNARQTIKPARSIEPGKSYSFNCLMSRMIAYSDNNATQLLLKQVPEEEMYQFLDRHQVDYERNPDGCRMSVRAYSWFLQALYDQSVLGPALSQKALSYLAKEDFPQGMHGAVPREVVVESKFGERTNVDENGSVSSVQLHEVGIVQGREPFLIGIMTQGTEFPVLERIIRDITHEVYEAEEHHG